MFKDELDTKYTLDEIIYRCKKCGKKNDLEPTREEVPRNISPGWFEPPVCARRHLGKPLKRMGLERHQP